MGLAILSQSEYEYHYSYSGIHKVRYLAYKYCGGEKDFVDFMEMGRENKEFDWPYIVALDKFRNLLWHSDCEGTYSREETTEPLDSKVGLEHGNSIGLLRELDLLKQYQKETTGSENAWEVFNNLFNLVKDCVENYDGKLEFC